MESQDEVNRIMRRFRQAAGLIPMDDEPEVYAAYVMDQIVAFAVRRGDRGAPHEWMAQGFLRDEIGSGRTPHEALHKFGDDVRPLYAKKQEE